jgi:hypothetical protein
LHIGRSAVTGLTFYSMTRDNQNEMKGFTDHFVADGYKYMINVKHYFLLSEEEREAFRVEDGQFLVHMFGINGYKTFKVFLSDDLNWATDSSEFLIDKESVEIIGSIIDERSTLNNWD